MLKSLVLFYQKYGGNACSFADSPISTLLLPFFLLSVKISGASVWMHFPIGWTLSLSCTLCVCVSESFQDVIKWYQEKQAVAKKKKNTQLYFHSSKRLKCSQPAHTCCNARAPGLGLSLDQNTGNGSWCLSSDVDIEAIELFLGRWSNQILYSYCKCFIAVIIPGCCFAEHALLARHPVFWPR